MQIAYLKTKIGLIEVKGDQKGIISVYFVDKLGKSTQNIDFILNCCQQIEQYFDKSLTNFNLTLNFNGTAFQKQVWNQLLKISYGKTISYSTLAQQMGDVNKTRAVGLANAKNPISIIVPCHRVIGANGNLTGYAGGLEKKKWLLEHEGAIKQMRLIPLCSIKRIPLQSGLICQLHQF